MSIQYPEIALQIIALQTADLNLRDQLIREKVLGEGYHPLMEQLHKDNAAKLDAIITKIGYPTISKVGKAGSEAAWLVIQHSIGQPAFMKKCLQLLQIAVEQQQAAPINLAYLSDRVATFEERPQLYGTQFDWNERGNMSPKKYDDLEKVNARRSALGLNTLDAQTAIMQARVQEEGQIPPPDFEARKTAMRAWKIKVGWILPS